MYDDLTKEWAIDTLLDRIEAKWPDIDRSKERALLAKWSRASLLHSVGAQRYGDVAEADDALMQYAERLMSASELRVLHDAG